MGAQVTRSAATVTQESETSNVGTGVNAQSLVYLTLAIDSQFVQRAGAADNQGVVDQTQVVDEVALALLLASVAHWRG